MAGATPLALALLGGGKVLDIMGEQSAARQRNNILNRSMERTQKTQDDATRQVLAEGENYGQKRLDDINAQEQTALAQSLRDIGSTGGAGGQLIDTAGSAGNVSGDFLKANADKAIAEGNRITQVARELAKVRAPGQQQMNEGLRRADLTSRLGSAATTNRNLANAAQLDAQNVDTPLWGKLGKIASSIGTIMAAGGPQGGIAGGVNGSAVNAATPRITMFG